MDAAVDDSVLVVIGAGGIGLAVARESGRGRRVVLADVSEQRLEVVRAELAGEGYDVLTSPVDVTSAASVAALAGFATAAGSVDSLVHTAGVSPIQATVGAIVAVDLVGTALVLDAFGTAMAAGGAGVFVASMAGHMAGSLGEEDERLLALTPAVELAELPLCLSPAVQDNPAWAYMVAKRGNQIRVRAAARAWGARGLRVNSVSPGVIATEMGREELASANGDAMRQLVADSSTGRLGTAEDIAVAVAFLLDPRASFVTGTDLLVDGGVTASLTPH